MEIYLRKNKMHLLNGEEKLIKQLLFYMKNVPFLLDHLINK